MRYVFLHTPYCLWLSNATDTLQVLSPLLCMHSMDSSQAMLPKSSQQHNLQASMVCLKKYKYVCSPPQWKVLHGLMLSLCAQMLDLCEILGADVCLQTISQHLVAYLQACQTNFESWRQVADQQFSLTSGNVYVCILNTTVCHKCLKYPSLDLLKMICLCRVFHEHRRPSLWSFRFQLANFFGTQQILLIFVLTCQCFRITADPPCGWSRPSVW